MSNPDQAAETKPDPQKEFGPLRRPSKGYLFVVTYGRSGSTLTTNLLNAIPGYCIRGENANALYHLCRLIDNLSNESNIRNRRKRVAADGVGLAELGRPTDPWYGAENIDVDQVALRLFNVFAREILHVPPRTRVAGFKEIRYLNDLPFLPRQLEIMQTYFPGARILFLTRRNEDVAQSAWWRNQESAKVLQRLGKADQAFHAYAETHPGCHVLDYASYAGGPEALRPLFDFLGEKMDPAKVQAVLDQKLNHAKHLGAAKA